MQNIENPLSCFKISKFGPSRQTVREIEYFKFLKKRGVTSSFLPTFFGGYYYNGQLVIEQELIKDRPEEGLFAFRVEEFVGHATAAQLEELQRFLRDLFKELTTKNIIICDLHAGNLMVYCDETGQIKRLIVIDGFGSPEAIPLAKYIPFFGRRKMERQWNKFKRTFVETLKRRGKESLEFNF